MVFLFPSFARHLPPAALVLNIVHRIACYASLNHSSECERSSVLRRLKTYMRSTMGQDSLSGFALMHTQYAMELDLEKVINTFTRKLSRQMVLSDFLGSDHSSECERSSVFCVASRLTCDRQWAKTVSVDSP